MSTSVSPIPEEQAVLWSLDSFILRNTTVFAFGWLFHPKKRTTEIRFGLLSEESIPETFVVENDKVRRDVQEAFKQHTNAGNCGFIALGSFSRAPTEQDRFILQCSFDDGSMESLVFPLSIRSNRPPRQLRKLIRRSLRLLAAGQFRDLLDKAKRYLKADPRNSLTSPAHLATVLMAEEQKRLCVILDHDLGGGANHYRNRMVQDLIAEGRTAIILSYHVATLGHMILVRNRRLDLRFSVSDENAFLETIRGFQVENLIYNTAVSFPKPHNLPRLLLDLKGLTSARLTVLAHDYFLACPSQFLLNQHGKFCRIPEHSVCSTCLPANRYGFTSLFNSEDIGEWRKQWGTLLSEADEIVAFSNDTAQRLSTIYPQISSDRIQVRPHTVDQSITSTILPNSTKTLCIGVVGHIGFHKGALIIEALAREIRRCGLDIRIAIIGVLERNVDASLISQTGPYRHDQLKDHIERSGANIMLFPSIWPETFSYVTQEIITLDLPLASFDLGAPAERIRQYEKGHILQSMEPSEILHELLRFHRRMYALAEA